MKKYEILNIKSLLLNLLLNKWIKIFTFLPKAEIESLQQEHQAAPHLRLLQKKLAEEVTVWVHGKEEYEKALKASEILFGRSTAEDLVSLDEEIFLEVFDGVPQAEVAKSDVLGSNIIDLLSEKSGFLKSKGEAKRELQGNAISVNKEKVGEDFALTAEQCRKYRDLFVQSVEA